MAKKPINLRSIGIWLAFGILATSLYFSRTPTGTHSKREKLPETNLVSKTPQPTEGTQSQSPEPMTFSKRDSLEVPESSQRASSEKPESKPPELTETPHGAPILQELRNNSQSSVEESFPHPQTAEGALQRPDLSLSSTPQTPMGSATLSASVPNQTNAPVSLTRGSASLSGADPLKTIRLNKAGSLDAVSLKPYREDSEFPRNPSSLLTNNSQFQMEPKSEIPPSSVRDRLLASNPTPKTRALTNSKPTANVSSDSEEDPPPFPSANDREAGKGGSLLSLAKPYCFLLPTNSPALECAMKSVKLIVSEYAKADVHVVPVFRWWGSDYSNNPSQLEEEAKQACNLEKAFPWIKGGNQTASIQAFVRHPIPSIQCGKDPQKDPVSGCSNLCPSGSPSFSTVSEDECSPGTALHESGHSNCCAAQCKNQGDCKPPPGVDAGCGLCLETGGQSASNTYLRRFLASKAPSGECKLTAAALESIRAGASPNPGYAYDPNKTYKPRGKKLDTIFGKKGVKKLLRGVGDKADGDGSGQGEGTPMSSDDGSATTRKTSSTPSKSTQENGENTISPAGEPKGYSDGEVDQMTQ